MTNESISARIRQCRERANLKQAEISETIGVSRSAVSQWERGITEPEIDNIKALARIFHVNWAWLQSGEGSADGMESSNIEEYIFQVPVLDHGTVAVWREMGTIPDTVEMISLNVRIEERRPSDKAFAMYVVGDAMEPEYMPGELIVFDPEISPLPGDLVLADVNGIIMMRRYRETAPGQFSLNPINPDWAAVTNAEGSSITILGTMIEHRRRRRPRS